MIILRGYWTAAMERYTLGQCFGDCRIRFVVIGLWLMSGVGVVANLLLAIGLLVLAPSIAYGQSELSGSVSLDTGQANNDYLIDITVRNHTLVVLPNLSILRPVISQAEQTVSIPAGSATTDFLVSGISEAALDYSIEFRCSNCGSVLPVQFYTPQGNQFSLSGPAYIDPSDFPASLDFVLESRGQISGKVQILSADPLDRDVRLRITIVAHDDRSLVIAEKSIIAREGTNSVRYTISGLPRRIGTSEFLVSAECLNCRTEFKTKVYQPLLSPLSDHLEVDFEFEDGPRPPPTAAIMLLLDD